VTVSASIAQRILKQMDRQFQAMRDDDMNNSADQLAQDEIRAREERFRLMVESKIEQLKIEKRRFTAAS
jgi:hypothetical protein